jgi:hypothetical protein
MAKKHAEKRVETAPNLEIIADKQGSNKSGNLLFLLALAIIVFVRFGLLSIPLERDEGGFAYIAQQTMASSAKLYIDLIDNKLPGLYLLYASFLNCFGNTETGVHLGLLVCSLVSTYLVFLLAKIFVNHLSASLAALAFGLYSASANVFGFAAHATQLLLPFFLGGLVLILRTNATEKKLPYFCAGLLMGVAFLVKQQVALLVLFSGVYLLFRSPNALLSGLKHPQNAPKYQRSASLIFGMGSILPFAMVAAYFGITGRLAAMWQCTFTLPSLQAKAAGSGRFNADIFGEVLSGGFQIYWLLAVVGLVLIWLVKMQGRQFMTAFFIVSVLSVFIGLGGYHHYYVLVLPSLALLIAATAQYVSERWFYHFNPILRMLPFIALLALPLLMQTAYFFQPNHTAILRKAYGMNPFPEMRRLADQLQTQLPDGGRVGLLGSEPELCFYLNTPPATRHLFMFPLLHQTSWSKPLQDEYLLDIKKTKPEFLVWVTMTGSWAPEYYKTPFFQSTKPIVDQFYMPFGKCEVFENGNQSVFVYGAEAQNYQFKGNYQIYLFKRKA